MDLGAPNQLLELANAATTPVCRSYHDKIEGKETIGEAREVELETESKDGEAKLVSKIKASEVSIHKI